MSMVVIVILKAVDPSLSHIWNPGLIPRLFKSSVNYVKVCIISLSLLFLIDFIRMVLKSYTHMTYIHFFPLLDLVGKYVHISKKFPLSLF